VSLILHLVYRTGRGRLACNEDARAGDRGARLALGQRLAILRPDAGGLNPIQFRPAAAATSRPERGRPLSWSGHHGESAARSY
jgi:hypothetical protein